MKETEPVTLDFEGLALRLPAPESGTDPMRFAVRAVGRVAGTRFERWLVHEVAALYGVPEDDLRTAVESVYGRRLDPLAQRAGPGPAADAALRADAANRWRPVDIEHAAEQADEISQALDQSGGRAALRERVDAFLGSAVRAGYLAVLLRDYARLRALEAAGTL